MECCAWLCWHRCCRLKHFSQRRPRSFCWHVQEATQRRHTPLFVVMPVSSVLWVEIRGPGQLFVTPVRFFAMLPNEDNQSSQSAQRKHARKE